MWKAKHNQTGQILSGSWKEISELDIRIWTKWQVKDNQTRNKNVVCYPTIMLNDRSEIAPSAPICGNLAFVTWNYYNRGLSRPDRVRVLILDTFNRKPINPWLGDQFGYPSM